MSSRARQSKGFPSPSKQRRKTPKTSITPPRSMLRNRLPLYLKPNASVEISSDEPGFRGSWYPGTVLSLPTDSSKCQIEYTTLFDDKDVKKKLEEAVDVVQLRPPGLLMSEKEKRKVIVVGDEVDAFYNDGWWEGTVTGVVDDGSEKFSVFFKSSREQIRFGRDELRFHREWVDGAWKPPVDEEEEKEVDVVDEEEDEEDVLGQVDKETARETAKEMFTSGTIVEVSSEEEGFKGSWFVANVVERIGEDKYLVEYRDLREEDEVQLLKEETDFLHMRPLPPSEEDVDFAVGDKVDAFYNDGWWVGDVIESTQDGVVCVFFRQSGEKMRFGRKGLRLHKDWINGTWELPLKRGEKKMPTMPKKIPCDRIVRPRTAIGKQEFSIGTLVEVNSEEEGFEDSWFPARLVEYRGNDECLIEFDKIKAEDGIELLREEVHVSQIRPRPIEMVIVNPFEKLDRVDALYNDGWWVGVIMKVLAKSSYLVHFTKTEEVLKFHHSQLRLHQEWIDGKWVASSKAQKV